MLTSTSYNDVVAARVKSLCQRAADAIGAAGDENGVVS